MWWTLLLFGCPVDPNGETKGVDADADGYIAQTDGGDDCDDADPAVNPGAAEICDDLDVDENCDGTADDADPTVTGTLPWSPDVDNDGYGDPAGTVQACSAPTSGGRWVDDATDCDDAAFPVNPGAVEVCDALDVDEDCDTLSDDADDSVDPAGQVAVYADSDGDGYGAGAGTLACDAGAGVSLTADDCDDTNGAVNPGAAEICDDADVDEDCDGLADSADRSVDPTGLANYYTDADGDGYGSESAGARCEPGPGESAASGDCDDASSAVNPGATEICDALDRDEDCDGLADDADSSVDPSGRSDWYPDADNDGYGSPTATPYPACDDPSSSVADYAADNTDCDESDRAVNPGAQEICDDLGVDEDCDGLVDSADVCNLSPDTGLVAGQYAGEIHVDSTGAFTSGQFGTDFTDADELPAIDSLCRNIGDWSENGRAPTPCSTCDWAFTLEVNDTVADGDWCAELGRTGGEWDGFSAGWAFASTYTYGGMDLELVLLYQYGRRWYPIFYNYGGYGYNTGDANDLEFRAVPYTYYYLY